MRGTVHNINHEKGFAFLQPEGTTDRQSRHFAHVTSFVQGTFERLEVGDVLEFESIPNDRGLQAISIRFIGE